MIAYLINVVLVLCVCNVEGAGEQLRQLQANYSPQQISNAEIRYLAGLSNKRYTDEVLNNILIPRVVGTPNHSKVFNYIRNELRKLNWSIEVDQFRTEVPIFGVLTFRNLVATVNPNADRYLVLACHYDSKYFRNEVFVGAIDSAVPCAMMLNLAKVLDKEFDQIRDRTDVSIKLIFFDGEEAFQTWTATDSIYGSRNLAAKYHNAQQLIRSTGETVSKIETIDILVLLDLIGHRDTTFYSFFQDTSNWYLRMAEAEDRLINLRMINPRRTRYFAKQLSYGQVEDDHVPFLRRNVPIIHLISTPFPREWHTSRDNRDLIDSNTVEDVNKILRVFVVEYLHIYLSDTSSENIPEKEL